MPCIGMHTTKTLRCGWAQCRCARRRHRGSSTRSSGTRPGTISRWHANASQRRHRKDAAHSFQGDWHPAARIQDGGNRHRVATMPPRLSSVSATVSSGIFPLTFTVAAAAFGARCSRVSDTLQNDFSISDTAAPIKSAATDFAGARWQWEIAPAARMSIFDIF